MTTKLRKSNETHIYPDKVDWKDGYLSSIEVKHIELLEDWEFREMRDWIIGILQTRFYEAYHALEAKEINCKLKRKK